MGELIADLRRLASRASAARAYPGSADAGAATDPGNRPQRWQVYRDACGMLTGELGVEPGREAQQMHQKS